MRRLHWPALSLPIGFARGNSRAGGHSLINHEELFFKDNGDPIRNLQYARVRCKRSLHIMLKDPYREPDNARHSSVSWSLMVGKNPLWVAKQRGHSVHVMLDVYAARTEGAKDSDIAAIKQATLLRPNLEAGRMPTTALVPLQSPEFVTDLSLTSRRCSASRGKLNECNGGERGIRTLEGLLTLTPLAGVRLRPLGHLSVRLEIDALSGACAPIAPSCAGQSGHDT